jgi:hypothetical protein
MNVFFLHSNHVSLSKQQRIERWVEQEEKIYRGRIIVGPFPLGNHMRWDVEGGGSRRKKIRKIQIFESMIYHTIEWSLREKKCVCAASSLKEDRRENGKRKHTSYIANYIQHLKYAGKRRWRDRIYFFRIIFSMLQPRCLCLNQRHEHVYLILTLIRRYLLDRSRQYFSSNNVSLVLWIFWE